MDKLKMDIKKKNVNDIKLKLSKIKNIDIKYNKLNDLSLNIKKLSYILNLINYSISNNILKKKKIY
jgi:hypothetical protein